MPKLTGPGFAASLKFSCIPSLGFPQATLTNVGVARWISDDGRTDQISITPLSASSTAGANAPTGVPAVQVVSDLDSPVWGPDAEVSWLDGNNLRPLQCARDYGTRLLCQAPDRGTATRLPISLQVIDVNHQGGPIKALVSTQQCGVGSRDCAPPLLWRLTAPQLIPSKSVGFDGKPDLTKTSWNVSFGVVNINKNSTATLATSESGSGLVGTVDCDVSVPTPCTVSFAVPRSRLASISDSMILTVSRGNVGGRARVANLLSNMKPILAGISPDYTTWYGQNLVYDQVQVGVTRTKVDCIPEGTSCSYAKSGANVKNNPWDTTGGQIYFVASDSGLLFPFLQTNPSGSNTALSLDPSKIWAPPKPAVAQGTAPAPATVPLQLPLLNPSALGRAIGNLAPNLKAETGP